MASMEARDSFYQVLEALGKTPTRFLRCTARFAHHCCITKNPPKPRGGKFDEFRRVVFQCSEGVIEEKGMDLRSLGFETVMMIWQNLYIYGFPCLRMDERSGVI